MAGFAGNKVSVATAVLQGIGAPVNQHTLGGMIGWFNAEGGHWNNSAHYNPLNTTLNMPGAGSINSVGVKSYNNWQQGIQATVQTLKQSSMSGIVNAFKSSDPQGVIHAISASPWGTSGNLVAQTINAAMGQKFSPGNANIGRLMSQPQQGLTGSDMPASYTTTNKPAMSTNQALVESMLENSGGGQGTGNLLNDAISLIQNAGTTKSVTANLALVYKASADAGQAQVGGDAQKLLGMIHQVLGGAYNQGNHAAIGESARQIRAQGTDCSGFVSWLMGPTGLGIWKTSLATPEIANAPGMVPGRGQSVTVWNNKQAGNAGHVFIQIGNQYFASEGGAGIRQISTQEAANYIQHGSDGGTYQALHPKGL